MDILLVLIIVVVVLAYITPIITTRNKLVPLQNGVYEARANLIGSLQKCINVRNRIQTIEKQYEVRKSQMHTGDSDATISAEQLVTNKIYQQLISDLMNFEKELHNRFEIHNSKAKAFSDARDLFPANFLRDLSGTFPEANFLDESMAPTLLSHKSDDT